MQHPKPLYNLDNQMSCLDAYFSTKGHCTLSNRHELRIVQLQTISLALDACQQCNAFESTSKPCFLRLHTSSHSTKPCAFTTSTTSPTLIEFLVRNGSTEQERHHLVQHGSLGKAAPQIDSYPADVTDRTSNLSPVGLD